jgi:purine-cytosine permease-like protein
MKESLLILLPSIFAILAIILIIDFYFLLRKYIIIKIKYLKTKIDKMS